MKIRKDVVYFNDRTDSVDGAVRVYIAVGRQRR